MFVCLYSFLISIWQTPDRGASAISTNAKYFAITNLADGINVFTLPDLDAYGSIAQDIAAKDNEAVSLKFIDDHLIVVGGTGGMSVYDVETLQMVARLQEESLPS